MIDLSRKELPNTITVNGDSFFIKTNFREWIAYSKIIQKKQYTLGELYFLFEDKIPQVDFSFELLDFFTNPNVTPRSIGLQNVSKERTFDYIEDGEYILSAFMQAYHIDLTSIEYMHWHVFKALFEGLPENTKMAQIMSYRGYVKSNKTQDAFYKNQQKIWKLPNIEEHEEVDIDDINDLFYNS